MRQSHLISAAHTIWHGFTLIWDKRIYLYHCFISLPPLEGGEYLIAIEGQTWKPVSTEENEGMMLNVNARWSLHIYCETSVPTYNLTQCTTDLLWQYIHTH